MSNPMATMVLVKLWNMMKAECGYGGIALCAECKKKGFDKYVNGDGLEASACDRCLNNMQAMRWDEVNDLEKERKNHD